MSSPFDAAADMHAFAMQLQEVRGKLDTMGTMQQSQNEATNATLSDLRADMKAMAVKLEAIAMVRHQTDDHKDSITRLWAKTDATSSHANRITWLAAGAIFMFSGLSALLMRTYNNDRAAEVAGQTALREAIMLQRAESAVRETRLDKVELYLAGDRIDPFKR